MKRSKCASHVDVARLSLRLIKPRKAHPFEIGELLRTSKSLPGPWKLPIIGNIHQLVGLLPHRALRDLANKHGALMHLQLGELSTVVVSSPEMAKEVMKTHDIIFASRPFVLAADIMLYNQKDIAFAPYGAHWRQLRKICIVELLSNRHVQSFRSIREEEVSDLISLITASAGKPVNLTEKILLLTSRITSRAAFGKQCKEQELFISVATETVRLLGGFGVADLFPSIKFLQVISSMRRKLQKLHKISDRLLDIIINEHKAGLKSPTSSSKGEVVEDLVGILLKCQEDGNLEIPLTTNNIKAVIMDVFAGGTETSSNTVEWAMAEMLKNPRVMERAQAEVRKVFDGKGKVVETDFHELKYLKLVIKETLRLHPAAPLVPRECREKCELNGYEIPIKTRIIVNAWAIGRDPNYWTEPESFFPERFLDCSIDYKGSSFEYIPFGAGRRMCPGMMFGLGKCRASTCEFVVPF